MSGVWLLFRMKKLINKVLNMEALELMAQIPDKSIDLVLTDPDYNAKGIGPRQRQYNKTVKRTDKVYRKFCRDWFRLSKKKSKLIVFTPGIANTHNYPQPDWQLCWYKACSISYNRYGGFNSWEPIFIYGKLPKGKRLKVDYLKEFTLNSSKGPEKNHPCPKPQKLWRRLVETFSHEKDIILDPFAGSFTTAAICQEMGRDWICSDYDDNYCEIGKERLKKVPLFVH